MTAHRVAGEPSAARVIHQVRACVRDGFGEVDTAPVFPEEADRTSVGGAHDVRFLLGHEVSSYTDGFGVGTVQAEKDAGYWVAVRAVGCGGHEGVVLRAAVDGADASDDTQIGGGDGGQIDAERVEDRAVARGERHLRGMLGAGGARSRRGEARGQRDLLHGERRDEMEVDPRVLLGKVACNTDAHTGKRLHGGIHHRDSHGSIGVAACHK